MIFNEKYLKKKHVSLKYSRPPSKVQFEKHEESKESDFVSLSTPSREHLQSTFLQK